MEKYTANNVSVITDQCKALADQRLKRRRPIQIGDTLQGHGKQRMSPPGRLGGPFLFLVIARYSTIHAIKSSLFRAGSPRGGSWLNSIVSTLFSVGPQPSFMILF